MSFHRFQFMRWLTLPMPLRLGCSPWPGGCLFEMFQRGGAPFKRQARLWAVCLAAAPAALCFAQGESPVAPEPVLATAESQQPQQPPDKKPQRPEPRGPTEKPTSVVVFGTLGWKGSGAGENSKLWSSWEKAYFPKSKTRGLPWGGGALVRVAFTPHRSFSAELAAGMDTLRMTHEDEGNGITVKATYAATYARFGVNCLFPRLGFVRPALGIHSGVGQFHARLKVGKETDRESNISLEGTAHFGARFETSEDLTIETSMNVNLLEGVLFNAGVAYAL